MPDGALPILDVRVFKIRGGEVHAVNDVSFWASSGRVVLANPSP
jgi:peptide/nickel transport system ATP-binding protein/oligopeptide transport system ATP-binding protein